MTRTALLLPLAAALALGTAAQAQPANTNRNNQQAMNDSHRTGWNGNLPINRATDVRNIRVACTGVGDRAESDARWGAYPVKIQTVGYNGQYLAGERITVSRPDGMQVARVKCDAPWLMMKLQPGRYDAQVKMPGRPAKSISFYAPEYGQRAVTVRFRAREASNTPNMPGWERDTVLMPSG